MKCRVQTGVYNNTIFIEKGFNLHFFLLSAVKICMDLAFKKRKKIRKDLHGLEMAQNLGCGHFNQLGL